MNTLLYPEAQSPKELAVRYTTSVVNRQALRDAQSLFNRAREIGVCQSAERMVNQANHLLTDAYMGGEENEDYWGQF